MRQIKGGLVLVWAVISIVLAACTNEVDAQKPKPLELKPVALDKTKTAVQETIYVPVYSYIYHYESTQHVINLATTLSVRNTDPQTPLIISAVRYYDTNGKLLKEYLKQPAELPPLASADYFIERNDVSGGLGANFIVEVAATKAIYEPVVEAVMISTESGRGISFVSPGRVMKRRGATALR